MLLVASTPHGKVVISGDEHSPGVLSVSIYVAYNTRGNATIRLS